MEIIDAHHHLWDTATLRYRLFDGHPTLDRRFTYEEFDAIATSLGIHSSICVEAASAGADGLAETRWLLQQIEQSDVVAKMVAWAPLEKPELPAYLDAILAEGQGRIVGIRRSLEFEPLEFASTPGVIEGVKVAASMGLVIDLVLFEPALPAVLRLVRACPDAQFVLDHLGKPGIRESRWQPWAAQLAEIAACPNVACKISGVATEADHLQWRNEELKPYVDHAIHCFGWHRVLFGSDWPVCNVAGGFERWLAAVQSIVADATDAAKQQLFHRNATRIYRLYSS